MKDKQNKKLVNNCLWVTNKDAKIVVILLEALWNINYKTIYLKFPLCHRYYADRYIKTQIGTKDLSIVLF